MDKIYGLDYILNIIILSLNNHSPDFGKHASHVYISALSFLMGDMNCNLLSNENVYAKALLNVTDIYGLNNLSMNLPGLHLRQVLLLI